MAVPSSRASPRRGPRPDELVFVDAAQRNRARPPASPIASSRDPDTYGSTDSSPTTPTLSSMSFRARFGGSGRRESEGDAFTANRQSTAGAGGRRVSEGNWDRPGAAGLPIYEERKSARYASMQRSTSPSPRPLPPLPVSGAIREMIWLTSRQEKDPKPFRQTGRSELDVQAYQMSSKLRAFQFREEQRKCSTDQG